MEIVFGLASIALAIIIIINNEIAVEILVVLFSFALLFFGTRNLAMGLSSKMHDQRLKSVLIGTGATVMILAALALLYPEIAIEAMIVLLAVTMVLTGSSAIIVVATHKYSKIQQGISIGAGVLVLDFVISVILVPDLALFVIIVFLSISFLINGMEIISSGSIGHIQENIFSFRR